MRLKIDIEKVVEAFNDGNINKLSRKFAEFELQKQLIKLGNEFIEKEYCKWYKGNKSIFRKGRNDRRRKDGQGKNRAFII